MIKKLLIFLTAASVAFGVIPIPHRTKLFRNEGKIIGGIEAAEGDIPYQASIETTRNVQECGATIINKEWILTAAHCSYVDPNRYQVRIGTLTSGQGGSVHRVAQIIAHEHYDNYSGENDIAVWKVDPPFFWNNVTKPAILPFEGIQTEEGTIVQVSGWGNIIYEGPASPVLLKVNLPILNKVTCNDQYSDWGGIPPNTICAGVPEGGKDACKGDSGGPLHRNCVVLGIVSFGNGCAEPNIPGVYTEVSAFRYWISSKTGL